LNDAEKVIYFPIDNQFGGTTNAHSSLAARHTDPDHYPADFALALGSISNGTRSRDYRRRSRDAG
jgi:hypothetical protein